MIEFDDTILELLRDEDFNDIALFESVASKVIKSGDKNAVKLLFNKMRFSFLSNGDDYRTKVLQTLSIALSEVPLSILNSVCYDNLVGNYLFLYILLKKFPIIDKNSAHEFIENIPNLEHLQEVCIFGFPYQEQIMLQLDERAQTIFSPEEFEKLSFVCNFLFQIDLLQKSRDTVEGYQYLYENMPKAEYSLRANMISCMLQNDPNKFFAILKMLGGPTINCEQQIIDNYFELWSLLEKSLLPIYFSVDNLRYNDVLFNGNFYFLKYLGCDGVERILFPFSQTNLSGIGKVYDPISKIFFTPKEGHGPITLRDVYSFRAVENIEKPTLEAITATKSMSEDQIDEKIRLILDDPNRTHHSPVEVADVLTQYLHVNNTNDLRWAGFITKGVSFKCVHFQDIAHQIVKACFSPIQVIFLVFVNRIDDEAQTYFIKECQQHGKSYCIIDCSALARLFMAYNEKF